MPCLTKKRSATLAKKIETGTQAKHRRVHAREITCLRHVCAVVSIFLARVVLKAKQRQEAEKNRTHHQSKKKPSSTLGTAVPSNHVLRKHVYEAAARSHATNGQPLLAHIAETIQLARKKNVCKRSIPDRCVREREFLWYLGLRRVCYPVDFAALQTAQDPLVGGVRMPVSLKPHHFS